MRHQGDRPQHQPVHTLPFVSATAMPKTIVHVADIEVTEESGMGRVAWHWQQAIERRGDRFIHIGPSQVGKIPHRGLFPYAAYRTYKRLGQPADVFLVHEAASGPFLNRSVPAAVFSHGLDRRLWEMNKPHTQISWKSRLLFPLWRLRQCDLGIRKGNLVLLINQEDLEFAQTYYRQTSDRIFLFRNGVHASSLSATDQAADPLTITFLASWSERKGTKTLIQAAEILAERGFYPHWLLAGTGKDAHTILEQWPAALRPDVEVVPRFPRSAETELLARTHIFVLPSYYEGQPLALLQAMASGRCCITTNCCGQRDFIESGKTGLLHSPGDAAQLADLLQQCLESSELRLKLGQNAELSMQNRRWDDVSTEIIDKIETALVGV